MMIVGIILLQSLEQSAIEVTDFWTFKVDCDKKKFLSLFLVKFFS